jgi:hypothetical protein
MSALGVAAVDLQPAGPAWLQAGAQIGKPVKSVLSSRRQTGKPVLSVGSSNSSWTCFSALFLMRATAARRTSGTASTGAAGPKPGKSNVALSFLSLISETSCPRPGWGRWSGPDDDPLKSGGAVENAPQKIKARLRESGSLVQMVALAGLSPVKRGPQCITNRFRRRPAHSKKPLILLMESAASLIGCGDRI